MRIKNRKKTDESDSYANQEQENVENEQKNFIEDKKDKEDNIVSMDPIFFSKNIFFKFFKSCWLPYLESFSLSNK